MGALKSLPNNEATLTPPIAILSWRPARSQLRARPFKLQFMKKSIQIIAILLLFNGPSLMGQQLGLAQRVSTHIELRKDTVLLGEPMYFQVVITNISDDIIYVQEGGDYRGGRPETFRVLALTEKNDTLDARDWPNGDFGGISFFQKNLPRQSRKYELFLTSWVEIQKPGTYKLVASKDFHITLNGSISSENYAQIEIVPKASSATLVVVEDHAGLGVFMEALVKEIRDSTNGRIIDGGRYWINENERGEVSKRLAEKIEMIHDINDPRIIPFLAESYRTNKYIPPSTAIRLLSKFSKEDTAFAVLKLAAQAPEESRCLVSEDSIYFVVCGGDIRPEALRGIMQRNDTQAVDFLVAKKDDGYPCERSTILRRARWYLSKANRATIYRAYMTDNHKVVRRVAKEEYEKMLKE